MATLTDRETDRSAPTQRLSLHLIRGAASCAVVILTFVVTRRGVVVSPDSVIYLSTAANVVDGSGLTTFLGSSLVDFPPGVPLVYAIGEITRTDSLVFVRLLNAVLAGITVWWASLVVERHTSGRLITVSAAVVLGAGTGLIAVTRAAWSEPLFILISLAVIVQLATAVSAETCSRRTVTVLVGLAWAAFFVRYVGLVVVPVSVLVLALRCPADGARATMRRCALFGTAAVAAPAVWLARNRIVDGTLVGARPPSGDTFPATAHRFVTVVGGWLVPDEALGLPSLAAPVSVRSPWLPSSSGSGGSCDAAASAEHIPWTSASRWLLPRCRRSRRCRCCWSSRRYERPSTRSIPD